VSATLANASSQAILSSEEISATSIQTVPVGTIPHNVSAKGDFALNRSGSVTRHLTVTC